jgi:hypothetical protein
MLPLLHEPNRTKNLAIGIGICLLIIGVYNVLFFNKYFPYAEGWFSVYAHQILQGQLPYRDFHFFLTPVYPYIIAAFQHIFGDGFIGLRILGMAVTLSLTTLLFLLFSRLFPVFIACVATIVSVVYWQSNVAWIGYNFLNLLHLFTLLSIFFICKYFDYDDHSFKSGQGWKAMTFLFCAGLLSSLVFLTKQSDGFFIVVFSFLAVAISSYAREGFRKGLRSMAIYSLGVVIPILVLLIWLISNGILLSFWNQVFVGASSSKGGVIAILFAWIPRLFTLANVCGLIVVILIIIALRIYCFPQGFMFNSVGDKDKNIYFPLTPKIMAAFSVILVLFMLCILLPYWNTDLSHNLKDNYFLNFIFQKVLLVSGFTGSLFLFCIYLFKIVRERKTLYYDIFIISTMSLGILWSTGTSSGIGDMGMILALGLLLGYLSLVRSYFNVSKILSLVFCVFLVLFTVSLKYIEPYNWWGLVQPDIRTATTSLDVKYLEGFVVSEQTARIYTEVTSIVEKYTKPGDSIYTFPNIPVFYLLTDRYPDTFAIVSWFDVLSDKYAEEDARRLLETPPKAIIYLDVPEWVWKGHEEAFRGGKSSGQRKIQAAIEQLVVGGNYQLEAQYDVIDGYTLIVWIAAEGFDSNTELLMHFDGTDNSTGFQDETGKIITSSGNTHISTGEKKFGTASGSFDGQGDYLTIPNSADFDFLSEDFTIDGWFYFNANDVGYQFLVDRRGGKDQTGWVFYLEQNNSLSFLSSSDGAWDNATLWDTGVVPETGTWMHLAIVRNGDVFTMYKNGIAIKTGNFSGSIAPQTANLTIGVEHLSDYAKGFNGYIDELRITKGIARWTTNFVPPALPYTQLADRAY